MYKSDNAAMAEKKIISRHQLDAFINSPTHADVVGFIADLNESAVGRTLRAEVHQSPVSFSQLLFAAEEVVTLCTDHDSDFTRPGQD